MRTVRLLRRTLLSAVTSIRHNEPRLRLIFTSRAVMSAARDRSGE
jgi:hypothetical protein